MDTYGGAMHSSCRPYEYTKLSFVIAVTTSTAEMDAREENEEESWSYIEVPASFILMASKII